MKLEPHLPRRLLLPAYTPASPHVLERKANAGEPIWGKWHVLYDSGFVLASTSLLPPPPPHSLSSQHHHHNNSTHQPAAGPSSQIAILSRIPTDDLVFLVDECPHENPQPIGPTSSIPTSDISSAASQHSPTHSLVIRWLESLPLKLFWKRSKRLAA